MSSREARRATLAVVLATVALIAWGMLFWGLLSGPFGLFRDLLPHAGQAMADLLQESGAETGTYFHPWPRDSADWQQAHREGPFFELQYSRVGVDPSSPSKLALGSLHNLVVVTALAALLILVGGRHSGARRFGILVLAGMVGTVFARVGDPVWFHEPLPHARGLVIYEVGAWLLVAAVLAWRMPQQSPAPSTG